MTWMQGVGGEIQGSGDKGVVLVYVYSSDLGFVCV